jgi:multicomponent Na+:H+ antiporter subunit G
VNLLSEALAAALLLLGAGFMLLAAVGALRLPDVYLRLSATTKSATLGVSSVLAAVAVGFADGEAAFTALLAAAFFFLTAPVAGHVIGRAAYFAGVPLWAGTRHDELRRDGAGAAPTAAAATPPAPETATAAPAVAATTKGDPS